MQNKSRAFTLIELLVVVLIIGILAAVAVPQYEKVVEKSKATQALTLLKSAYQAAATYYMANGTYPVHTSDGTIMDVNTLNQLGMDIQLPALTDFRYDFYFNNKILYRVGVKRIIPNKCSFAISQVLSTSERKCHIGATFDTNDICAQACKSLCGTSTLKSVFGSGDFGCFLP